LLGLFCKLPVAASCSSQLIKVKKLIISIAAVMQTLWTKVLLRVDLQLLMLLLQLIQCKVQYARAASFKQQLIRSMHDQLIPSVKLCVADGVCQHA
jgi:hypothetical protein